MKVRLLVPQVKPLPEDRPQACRWCGSPLLQRHQTVLKALIDTHIRETQAVRYRCTRCGHTFRHYAEGASRYRQSQRVMGLAVLRWLRPYVERLGVQVLVTDDLVTYKPVVDELGVEHQVCLAHVRKGVTNRLTKVEGWEEDKARIQQLVRQLPQGGGAELLRLERRGGGAPPLPRLGGGVVRRG